MSTTDEPTRRNVMHDIVSAFSSGVLTTFITQPLDTVKTRFQVQNISKTLRYTGGTFHTLATIAREEGPKALYRGLPPSILSISLSMALYFPVYQKCRESISDYANKSKNHPLVIWPSVFTGWLVSSVIQCPLSLLRVRLQTMNQTGSTSMIHTFRTIVKNEGFLALYQGYQGHAIATIFFSLYFSMYEPLKSYLQNATGLPIMYVSPLASGTAHLIACLVSYPNDLILARLQFQQKSNLQYTGYRDAFKKVYRTEGPRGLYAGLNAVILRYSVGEMTRMTFYETGLHYFQNGETL